jgi:molybdate transport system substrate-binding protein
MKHSLSLSLLPVLFLMGCAPAATPAVSKPRTLHVFAAASLTDAFTEIGRNFEAANPGTTVSFNFSGSQALRTQIEEGAPADIFFSADEQWMDYVAERKLIAPATRVDVVGNRLVLIAPKDRVPTLTIAPGFALAPALGSGRLAVADPVNVPAGRYGKAALTTLGVWDGVANRLAPADNVRAALAFVARGEAPLGIVYASDVVAEPGVVVVGTFPANTHPRILYPAALTARAKPDAKKVLDVIASAEARAIFVKHGFLAPGS